MDVTVPFDPGAAGLVLVQASPELTSNMSFPFYKSPSGLQQRAFIYTLSISTVDFYIDFYILFITLRVVSQFLYTTGESEQKLVSRFLFLDF